MKIGDKVRFLNEVGGGVVKGFQGKDIVLVEDADGFDIPISTREVVVINTDDYNLERIRPQEEEMPKTNKQTKPTNREIETEDADVEFEAPAVELKGGDILNVSLAFVPEDIKMINATSFDTYLINDSNYYLQYTYLSGENGAWKLRAKGEIAPNMKAWVESFMQSDLNELEHLCVQFMAYKKDKAFELHAAVDVSFNLDTVKFYKIHCFGDSDFFEQPAMLYDIVKDNVPFRQFKVSAKDLEHEMMQKKHTDEQQPARVIPKAVKEKHDVPVFDLHIDELLDTTAGMSNSEMLNYQLAKFHEGMKKFENKHGQHLIFIHGKGNGVLRNAIWKELKSRYNHTCHWQDASFQEYGFGATEVIMR